MPVKPAVPEPVRSNGYIDEPAVPTRVVRDAASGSTGEVVRRGAAAEVLSAQAVPGALLRRC